MAGNDPDSHAPTTAPDAPDRPAGGADRTIEANHLQAHRPPADLAVTGPRLGGGISLIVAFLGLVGAALGAGWLGLDSRYGLSPGGLWGIGLTLIAATLTVVGLLLLVGGLGYYVLAPAFGPRQGLEPPVPGVPTEPVVGASAMSSWARN